MSPAPPLSQPLHPTKEPNTMKTKPQPIRLRPTIGRWHCNELATDSAPPFCGALWQAAGNTKVDKTREHYGETLHIFTHTMNPGSADICPQATPGCKRGCVIQGGLARLWQSIGDARKARNRAHKTDPEAYLRQLADQVISIVERYEVRGIWRGNTGSDIDIRPAVKMVNAALTARGLPKQLFYDYTKRPEFLTTPGRPGNHYLTFSRSEQNEEQALDLLHAGESVAVVFHQLGHYAATAAYRQRLPEHWRGYQVHDGDLHDIRIPGIFDPPRRADGRGYVIGLRLKGDTRQREAAIAAGFSVQVD